MTEVDKLTTMTEEGCEVETIARKGVKEFRQVNSHFELVKDTLGSGRNRVPTTCYLVDGDTVRQLFVGAATVSQMRAYAKEIAKFFGEPVDQVLRWKAKKTYIFE